MTYKSGVRALKATNVECFMYQDTTLINEIAKKMHRRDVHWCNSPSLVHLWTIPEKSHIMEDFPFTCNKECAFKYNQDDNLCFFSCIYRAPVYKHYINPDYR